MFITRRELLNIMKSSRNRERGRVDKAGFRPKLDLGKKI